MVGTGPGYSLCAPEHLVWREPGSQNVNKTLLLSAHYRSVFQRHLRCICTSGERLWRQLVEAVCSVIIATSSHLS